MTAYEMRMSDWSSDVCSSDLIDRGWMEQLALHTQVVIKQIRLNYNHGRLLYAVLRRYLAECRSEQAVIFETGTARGFSALCMARALQEIGSASCRERVCQDG